MTTLLAGNYKSSGGSMDMSSHKNMVLFLNSLLYVIFFVHFFTVSVSGYTSAESFFIYCGSRHNYTASDGREWIGDISSDSFFSFDGGASYPPDVPDEGTFVPPLASARVSHSHFTYRFPVTPGPKYIRFHFNPDLHLSFPISQVSFSVKSGGYTLLRNFNASLAASDPPGPFTKEFVIYAEDPAADPQMLNITFIPTKIGAAYAFISGIEVVSMPDYLYYSSPQDVGFQFIGQENLFSVDTHYALENVYRLNVGGSTVSAGDDTGMFRTWEADDRYFREAGVIPANTTAHLKFTHIPNYTAPVVVYQTARSMGNNKTENMAYNLTWVLPVYTGFSYIVRLHFCEFQPEIQNQRDRQFTILIGNQTAEKHADVITWSGGNGVPIYRDYAILMLSQGSHDKKQDLYIQLHPNPDNGTVYSDAILNGIELFKLSNYDKSLAGTNQDPSPPTPARSTSSKSNKTKIIITVASTGGAVVILCYLIIVHQMKRNRDSPLLIRDRALCMGPRRSSALTSDSCFCFSLQEIKMATKNFDKGYIIGGGGFGNVYKGYINGGTTPVAIKRLNPESQQGANEFMTEIEMLSQLRYVHLVSLIGYCNHKREMILVYEHMANGNLRDHLYNTDNPPLPWTLRLQICIGAARGLHYLHAGVKKTIIHRDIKTTNILLDHKWVAKVSDFGLSKMSPTSVANAHISTVVKGSFGYLDPEYFRFQRLNEKSDVYSFGVVLLEVLCARPPVNQTGDCHQEEEEQAGLVHWAVSRYKNGKLEEIVDPHLKGGIAPMCLEKYAEIAASCVLDERFNRPSMLDVVKGLEVALELQEKSESESGKGNTINDQHPEGEILSETSTSTDYDDNDCLGLKH